MSEQHSPLPWLSRGIVITTDDGDKLIGVAGYRTQPFCEARANARFIVTACNAHERLVTVAAHTLAMLRACRDHAPAEWDALIATPAGSWLTSTWDDLKAAVQSVESGKAQDAVDPHLSARGTDA